MYRRVAAITMCSVLHIHSDCVITAVREVCDPQKACARAAAAAERERTVAASEKKAASCTLRDTGAYAIRSLRALENGER